MTVTASEVKAKGVSIFDKLLDGFSEVVINVRGKDKYCVIPFDEYEEFRAFKLEKARNEVMQDIEKGQYHASLEKHFNAIEKAIEND